MNSHKLYAIKDTSDIVIHLPTRDEKDMKIINVGHVKHFHFSTKEEDVKLELDNENRGFEEAESLAKYMIKSYIEESNIKDFLSEDELSLIRYNPNVTKDNSDGYLKYKGSTHDGTLLFVYENYLNAIHSMYNLYIGNKDKLDNIEFGDIDMESDFGMKNINDMTIRGETDIVIIPMKIRLKEV